MSSKLSETFTSNATPGFCPYCGSILPMLRQSGNVTCYTCKHEYDKPDVFGKNECEYTIEFNKYTRKSKADKLKEIKNEEDEGPVVERKCPQCGNNKMSYATLQLRSADEGQTVFFTCTKCKFKETENS